MHVIQPYITTHKYQIYHFSPNVPDNPNGSFKEIVNLLFKSAIQIKLDFKRWKIVYMNIYIQISIVLFTMLTKHVSTQELRITYRNTYMFNFFNDMYNIVQFYNVRRT